MIHSTGVKFGITAKPQDFDRIQGLVRENLGEAAAAAMRPDFTFTMRNGASMMTDYATIGRRLATLDNPGDVTITAISTYPSEESADEIMRRNTDASSEEMKGMYLNQIVSWFMRDWVGEVRDGTRSAANTMYSMLAAWAQEESVDLGHKKVTKISPTEVINQWTVPAAAFDTEA